MPVAKKKGLQIVNEVGKDCVIFQYREPLKILLHNLLANAINFSEKGAIRIHAETTPSGITLALRDEGIGMTTEQINNILSNQFIVSSANVDNRKGNGLGYLIIKDLLRMMHAEMHISSERGAGTTVQISLHSS